MTNRQMLRDKIEDCGFTMKHLANKCGISPQAFSSKMTGKTEFSGAEMNVLRIVLRLSDDDFIAIFFNDEVA